MARYFFHLRRGNGDEVTDDYGDELPDDRAAEDYAIQSIKEIVKGSPLDWSKASFEVHDESGRHVMTAWFREAAVAPVTWRSRRAPPHDQHAQRIRSTERVGGQ
jgi:hypothetical protein